MRLTKTRPQSLMQSAAEQAEYVGKHRVQRGQAVQTNGTNAVNEKALAQQN